MNCQECDKYLKCRELCEQAEKYVNQDTGETQWQKISFTIQIEEMELKPMSGLLTSEAILQNYFIDRMKQCEIAQKYGISRPYVSKVVKKYSALIIKNIKKSTKNG
jgi:DNA-directed RNA polymerase specialized sigma subunit